MSVMLPLSIEPGAGARLRPAPLVQASSGIEVRLIQESSLLSVVIPVYNEARWVGEVVRRVQAAPIGKEIIVVDDGSTDGTADVLATLTEENVRIVSLAQNRGKGSALREGFARARGDVVLIQDADLEYDPGDYPRLLSPLWEGNADVVYGWRRGGGCESVLVGLAPGGEPGADGAVQFLHRTAAAGYGDGAEGVSTGSPGGTRLTMGALRIRAGIHGTGGAGEALAGGGGAGELPRAQLRGGEENPGAGRVGGPALHPALGPVRSRKERGPPSTNGSTGAG